MVGLSNRLSRWTLAMFACALINFLLAQALIVAGIAWPVGALTGGATLAAVHLVTIGWLSVLILGALFQFVPVITTRPLLDQRLSGTALVLIEAGLVGMVAGFFTLGVWGTASAVCLTVGGSAVAVGAIFAIVNLVSPLLHTHPLPLPGRFVRAGLFFLVVTMFLGLVFALTLSVPALCPPPLVRLIDGVGYHALAGIGGWLTLTAMGVSYKLLPMFMLAPEARGRWGETTFKMGVAGFGIAVGAGLLGLWLPGPAVRFGGRVGWLFIGMSITVYLVDLVRLYRARRRPQIEIHNRAAAGAFISLALALVATVLFVVAGQPARDVPPIILLILFGWLSGLGLTQLYKVIPFLSWLTRFGPVVGRGKIPRVQDMVRESRAAPWFWLYFGGVALSVVGATTEASVVVRTGVALSMVATSGLCVEYWRAWRGTYALPTPMVPSSTSAILKEELKP